MQDAATSRVVDTDPFECPRQRVGDLPTRLRQRAAQLLHQRGREPLPPAQLTEQLAGGCGGCVRATGSAERSGPRLNLRGVERAAGSARGLRNDVGGQDPKTRQCPRSPTRRGRDPLPNLQPPPPPRHHKRHSGENNTTAPPAPRGDDNRHGGKNTTTAPPVPCAAWRARTTRSKSRSTVTSCGSRARTRCCFRSGARPSSTCCTTTRRSPSRSCARWAGGPC